MSAVTFLVLLSNFAVITALTTEAIKKLTNDNIKSYNLVSFIVSIVVGTVGTLIYYQLDNIGIDTNSVICAVLLGYASGIASQVGYDKVKQTIEQLM